MFKKELLDNGIRVVTENIPHVRSVSIGIWVDAGVCDETDEQNGISHFVEHMLFKGTKTRSAKDIAVEVDSIGGELNAFTTKECTTYYAKVLDDHLPTAVDLLSDIFHNSLFDEKEMERERSVIIEEIKMVEDTPDDMIHELFYGNVWKGSRLGHPILGTKRSIRRLTRQDLIDYMAGTYVPSGIVISATGNFKMKKLLDLLNSKFGRRRKKAVKPSCESAGFNSGMNIKFRKLEQVHLCMGVRGYPYAHDDRYGTYAVNSLLGNSMSSRLYQEIRERRGLAYSVYSYLTSLKDTGLFTIYAAVSPSKAASVVRLISKEIKKLKAEGVLPDELSRVKEQLKGNLVLAMENTNSRMSQLAKQEMYFGRHFTLDEMLAQIEDVNLEQLHRIIDEIFVDDKVALSALGPVSKEDMKSALAL